jgi:hypothetical protein
VPSGQKQLWELDVHVTAAFVVVVVSPGVLPALGEHPVKSSVARAAVARNGFTCGTP